MLELSFDSHAEVNLRRKKPLQMTISVNKSTVSSNEYTLSNILSAVIIVLMIFITDNRDFTPEKVHMSTTSYSSLIAQVRAKNREQPGYGVNRAIRRWPH